MNNPGNQLSNQPGGLTPQTRNVFHVVSQFRHYSLRTKLIIAFVVVSVLSVGAVAFLTNRATRSALTEAANQALFGAASQTAANLDTFINSNLDAVRTQSHLPVLAEYLGLPPNRRSGSAQEREVLAILQALSPTEQTSVSSHVAYVTSYALLDSQGRDVLDTSTRDIGTDKSDRDYFKIPFRSGVPYVSPVQFSQSVRAASLYFSSPVRDANKKVIGVLRARYSAAILQRLIAQNNRLAEQRLAGALFDENYIYLAHSTTPEKIFRSVAPLDPAQVAELQAARRLPNLPVAELSTDSPALEQKLANVAVQPYFTVEDVAAGGKVNQAAAVTLETQPWLVAFFQPQEVFLAPVENQTRNTALLAVLIAGLVAIVAAGVAQWLAGPITRLTTVVQQVTGGDLKAQAPVESRDETGQLATAFNSMTAQLRQLIGTLEERVAARTQRLEIGASLSERLSAILNLEELLAEVVNQVKDNFGYYHAHIYLVDDRQEKLVVAAGTGVAGEEMKAKGHSIPLAAPTSLVARAARSGEIVSVDNVREAEDWLPNPLLPDTYSEMAVPIILEGQVVGVLDVQQDEVAGLDEGDANLLRSLANQVAVAIRNARLFEEVEHTLDEARTAQERYVEQSWQKSKAAVRHSQHLYADPDAAPMDAAKQQAMAKVRQQAQEEAGPTVVTVGENERQQSLVAPVNLREKTIGTLQLYSSRPDQSWTDDDLAVIEAVVDQLAETAESMRLFEETRSRAGREQTIREITEKMRTATSLEELVKTATEELGERLSAGHALVELGLDVASSQLEEGNGHGH